MIVAPRREGGLPVADEKRVVASFWRRLDRVVPLGFKLLVPVVLVTLAGTFLFGWVIASQSRNATVATYEGSGRNSADAAAAAFYAEMANSTAANYSLISIAQAHPEAVGIWIVSISSSTHVVVASSKPADIGRTDILDAHDADEAAIGVPTQDRSDRDANILETVVPVRGDAYAAVVWTSLSAEDDAIRATLGWVAAVGIAVCGLEILALITILEIGVVRRIRRVGNVVDAFGQSSTELRLSEGMEPEGADVLFNLARRIDHKLSELRSRERAGAVVSELGLMALQGAAPAELTRRALSILRRTGGLDRCFLVDSAGAVTIVEEQEPAQTTTAKLPIWLGALVRSAAQARRPLLAEGLGQDSRIWEASERTERGAAAFVPLAGNPAPLGVIVGVAPAGSHLSPATISMMEVVATVLGESLQRGEAEKARHESEVKSRALSTVSHEMRNPLNAMLGFSNLLLSGAAGPLNPKQEAYVKRVDEASHHLLRLVNDYLDLARVMNGSLPIQPEPVMVSAEVASVVDLLKPTADEKGVSLRAESSTTAIAKADRMRLRQVLVNLISNAVKFTPSKGHVRVEVAGGSNGVRISVIDTGVGIPADQQHLVFTEFARLRTNGAGQGAGLGLALSKRFVEAMGGFIRFTSAEGAGTIFDVWLPGEQTPVVMPTPAEEAPPVAVSA